MEKTITVNGELFDIYLTEEQIAARVEEMPPFPNAEYATKAPVFVGVPNGSFIIFADLIRHITIDCEVDFIKLSSYGAEKISSGKVSILKDLNCEVNQRHIVVVEDIVDSGLSIDFLRKLILRENPASLSFVTLLMKKEVAKIDFPVDHVGFDIPAEFVIGYGLDYAQKLRNLRAIYRQRPLA